MRVLGRVDSSDTETVGSKAGRRGMLKLEGCHAGLRVRDCPLRRVLTRGSERTLGATVLHRTGDSCPRDERERGKGRGAPIARASSVGQPGVRYRNSEKCWVYCWGILPQKVAMAALIVTRACTWRECWNHAPRRVQEQQRLRQAGSTGRTLAGKLHIHMAHPVQRGPHTDTAGTAGMAGTHTAS